MKLPSPAAASIAWTFPSVSGDWSMTFRSPEALEIVSVKTP